MKDINLYTRVTNVLYPLSGLTHIPTNILKNAADRGSKVHAIIDALICNMGIKSIDEEVKGYIDSFSKWIPKNFIEKPPRFFCDELMLTGECDAIYEEDDGLVLVDFKTPVNESKTWKLQASAYHYLAIKSGYNIKRLEFVKLSKIGDEPKVYVYEENFQLFLKCFEVYKYFFKHEEKESVLDYL